MGIKNKLAGTIAALSLAVGFGCDMLSPEGVIVKRDADGIITREEEKNIGALLESQDYANDFVPFRAFVNDFNVFMGNELASQGLSERRFSDDLHVYMVRDEDEMMEKYRFGNKPWIPPAFHVDINSTIYILKNIYLAPGLIMTFFHEAGHDIRNDAYEFPSQAHEMYFAFRAISMNKKIGSVFANYAVPVPRPKGGDYASLCVPIDEYLLQDYNQYYFFGDLGFIAQANLENGNLEGAFNNILTRPMLYLEQNTKEAARQYNNICEATLGEFNKLIEKPEFIAGLLRNMGEDEAMEFRGYLRLRATDTIYSLLDLSGRPVSSAQMTDLVHDTELFYNNGIDNTFFRNNVLSMLSYHYYLQAAEIANIPDSIMRLEDKIKLHSIAKRIIDVNRDYPCQYRFYECMGDAAEIRVTHVLGYLFATAFSNELIASGNETPASMILIPQEFAAKFYPNFNYHYEDNNANVAAYSPQIFFFAGNLEENMAGIAARDSDNAGFVRHLCSATEWYQAAVDAGCARIPDAGKKAECKFISDRSIEHSAQRRLNNRHSFYQNNCI